MAKILQAKELLEKKLGELTTKVSMQKKAGIHAQMRVFLIGDNPASLLYIANKKRLCEKIGAKFDLVQLEPTIKKYEFEKLIIDTNKDDSIHGCFIQLPFGNNLNKFDFFNLIDPDKDLDCFHAQNIANVYFGDNLGLAPCTPKGIIALLKENNIEIKGKHAVVIGRSHIVGRPLSIMLNNEDATVSLCHHLTNDLMSFTKKADIIISAIGVPKFFTPKYFRDDQTQVLIDVGINKIEIDGQAKIVGDMDFDNLLDNVHAITPVPGGVGPLTVLSLMENLVYLAEKKLNS